MAGNAEGGKKAAETTKKRYRKHFHARAGSRGGKAKNPNKGFGSLSKRQLKKVSSRGGKSVRATLEDHKLGYEEV